MENLSMKARPVDRVCMRVLVSSSCQLWICFGQMFFERLSDLADGVNASMDRGIWDIGQAGMERGWGSRPARDWWDDSLQLQTWLAEIYSTTSLLSHGEKSISGKAWWFGWFQDGRRIWISDLSGWSVLGGRMVHANGLDAPHLGRALFVVRCWFLDVPGEGLDEAGGWKDGDDLWMRVVRLINSGKTIWFLVLGSGAVRNVEA